jgi:hypothetical protein
MDNGVLASTAGNIAVVAQSSDQQTSVAGSFGLGDSTGGAGSIAINLFNMGSDPLGGTRAIVGTDTVIKAGGQVAVIATNPTDDGGNIIPDSLTLVTGSVGLANETAVGIALAVATRNDTFIASVGDRSKITEGLGLDVGAAGGLDISMVAAAGAGGLEDGAAGSLTISTLTETATATIGQTVTVTGTSTAADVDVTAEDRTTMEKVAGAVNFGQDLAIGAGLDVGVLTKTTIASIGAHSNVTTPGTVEVTAFSKEKINAFAASGGASSDLAISGSISTQVDSITTRAFIEGTTSGAVTRVTASGNVIVQASAENEMDLFAGGLGVSGSAAIGASAPIPIITKLTEAFIGQSAVVSGLGLDSTSTVRDGGFTVTYVDAPPTEATTPLLGTASFSLNGDVQSTGVQDPTAGDPNSDKERLVSASTVGMRGVAVSATNYDDIGLVAISGGVAGSIAVNVTGVVNVSNITTSGRIDKGASVNSAAGAGAGQDVLVVGSDDYRKLTVAVGVDVGGEAAIAPTVSVDVINLTTEAVIAGTAKVNAANSVGVMARTGEDIESVVASVGVAGSAGISGSPAILVLNDNTTARIGDIGPDVAANVKAGGSVVVQALDDTSILDVDGAVGVGGDAGAGVGLAINVVSKNTVAEIANGSSVDAAASSGAAGVSGLGGVDGRFGNTSTWSGLLVLAGTTEDISSIAIAGGVAGDIGGAGAVNLNIITSNTAATIGNLTKINQNLPGFAGQDVRVDAMNDVTAVAVTGGLGAGGSGGLAGAIGVGIVHNGTQASIGTSAVVNAVRDVSVEATSHQDITAVDISGGLGGEFAAAISFGTWVIGGAYNTDGGSASESSWATDYQNTLNGSALGGFSGMLGGNQTLTFTSADVGANAINLHTSTLQTGDAVVYHGSSAGLVDGQTYFLIKTGAMTYELAATAADADQGIPVALGGASSGSIELASNSRAQAGLDAARNGIVAAQPTNQLSSSLGAGTGQQGTVALINNSSTVTAGGGMDVTAVDTLDFTQVAGQVALAGGAGIGGAFATLIHNNTVSAQVGNSDTILANGTGLDLEAHSSEDVVQVAAGGAGGAAAGILGSGTVTILNENTSATIGKSTHITGHINSGSNPDVKVISTDDTTVTDVAGAIGFGGGAAVGVGADAIILTKTTLATIGASTQITTQGSVELRANTTEGVVSVAAVGSAAGGAAVGLSASVVVANITTQATITGASTTLVNADGNVVVEAVSKSEFDLWGIAANFAGAAAIGASAAVPVITKNVLAQIGAGASVTGRGIRNATSVHDGTFGDVLTPDPMDVTTNQADGGNLNLGSNDTSTTLGGSGGNQRQGDDANQSYSGDNTAGALKASANSQSGFHGVAVTATNSDDVSSTGIAIGGALGVAVDLTGSVQVVNATTQALIGKSAQINTLGSSGSQSVLVAAGDDFRSLDVAAGLSIAAEAAVTPVASVQIVSLNTSAIIDAGANVNAGNSVVVQADAREKFTAAAAAGAGAVFAGVAVSPNVMTLNSTTVATIGGSGSATVNAGGSVGVIAEDDSQFTDIAAAMGVGFGGVGIGGNVLIVTKHTQALVTDNSSVTANANGSQIGNVLSDLGSQAQNYAIQDRAGTVGGVVVQATSHEDFTAITGSVGVGLVGVGLAADVVVVDSDTLAHIGNNTSIHSGGSVIVGSANTLESFTLAGAVGIGLAGVGGGVTVGIVRNGVEASIGNNAVVAGNGSVEVIALSRKDVDSFDIAGGAGAIALAGSVGVWTFGGAVSTNYSYSTVDGDDKGTGTQKNNALGGGASGWNTTLDQDANGSNAPGGSYSSILSGQGGNGGNTSRLAAANAMAQPLVGSAKPKTSITAELNNPKNDIEGTTASIGSGDNVSAHGNVVVRAKDATTLSQTSGSFSGGVISVGVPVALVTLNMPVQAVINSNAVVSAGLFLVSNGDVIVEAGQTTKVEGFVFAGTGGLIAGSGQILIITDNTDQSAWVHAGAQLSAVGNVTINATSSQNYSGGALGATISALSVGASVAIANVNGGTHALMDGNVAPAFENVSIAAMADIDVSLQVYGLGLAALGGLDGAIATSHIGHGTEAHISDSSSTQAIGDVTVSAVEIATANLSSYAIQLSGVLGMGFAVAIATIDPSVTSHAGGSFSLFNGTLSVVSEFNTDAAGNQIANSGAVTDAFSVGGSVVAAAAGAVAVSTIRPTVLAEIDDGTKVLPFAGGAPNVVVRSLTGSNAAATASGIGIGVLVGGAGGSVALANVGGSNKALATGGGLVLGNANNRIGAVTVDARSADDASANSLAGAGGILGGFSGNIASADVENSVLAELGLGATVVVDSATVNAGEDGGSHAQSKGVTIAGGFSGAASVSTAIHNVGVDAIVDGSTIDMLNGLSITADTQKGDADAESAATAAALLVGGNVNSATAKSTGHTKATLQNANVTGNQSGAVVIHAQGFTNVYSDASGQAFGLLGVGSTTSTALNSHTVDALMGANVHIGSTAHGDAEALTVDSLEVSALGIATGHANAEGAAGGAIASPHVNLSIDITPYAHATVMGGDSAAVNENIKVDASSYAEGDSGLLGKSIAALSFGSMSMHHLVSQDAEAIVDGGAQLLAGEDIFGTGQVQVTAEAGDPASIPTWENPDGSVYNGTSTANLKGLVGALIGAPNGAAIGTLNSTARAKILDGSVANPTVISGDEVEITATTTAKLKVVSDNESSELVGDLSSSRADAFVNATTEAIAGDQLQGGVGNGSSTGTGLFISSQDNLGISANAILGAEADSTDNGGALIASFGATDGQARTFYVTTAGFGQDVNAFAGSVDVTANTSHMETTILKNTSSGGLLKGSFGGNDDSGSFVSDGSLSQVLVGGNTLVSAFGALHLTAQITNSTLDAETNAFADGDGVKDIKTTATAIADDKVNIDLASGSHIIGADGVYIAGSISNYTVNTRATADSSGTFSISDADSYSENDANVAIVINAEAGATVEANRIGITDPILDSDAALTVTTNLNVIRAAFANTGSISGVSSADHYNGKERDSDDFPHDDSRGDKSTATINWNANVILDKIDAERFLTIDANGVITAANGISVDGWEDLANEGIIFPLVGYHTGSTISVDDIIENALPNRVVFKATQDNVTAFPDGTSSHETDANSGRNVIQGTLGTWYVGLGSGVIAIDNYSDHNLEINNIETVTTFGDSFFPSVSIDINNASGFKFAVSPFYGTQANGNLPSIQITNHVTQLDSDDLGNIIINGHIDNPVGLTFISAGAGQILENDDETGLITTYQLTMDAAGNIGTPGTGLAGHEFSTPSIPVKIEFVQSPGRTPTASIDSDGVTILDVSTRLRDPSQSHSTVNFNGLGGQNGVSVTFHDAADDAEFQSLMGILDPPLAGIEVIANHSATNDAAHISTAGFYRFVYYPDTAFGTPSVDVASAFGNNFGATAPATYNINAVSSNANLIAASNDVTINRPFIIIFPFFASTFSAPTDQSIVVPLSAPSSMTADETPINTVLGSASTSYFNVTESDLAAMAAAAAAAPDVLLQDFATLAPALPAIDRVTKPEIVWQ